MEQIFKDNPRLDIAYKTADGKYFFLESDAQNYANTLKNKKVEKLERPTEQEEPTAEVQDEPSGEENTEAPSEKQEELEQKVQLKVTKTAKK